MASPYVYAVSLPLSSLYFMEYPEGREEGVVAPFLPVVCFTLHETDVGV